MYLILHDPIFYNFQCTLSDKFLFFMLFFVLQEIVHGIFMVVHGLELLTDNFETDPSLIIACFQIAPSECYISLHRGAVIMDVVMISSLIFSITA